MAASPLSNHSSSSEAARQRSLRRPHQLRQRPATQAGASAMQQRLPQTLPMDSSSYFGNTAKMFNVPIPYSADNKIDDNRDLLEPYCSTQPYLDWSTSPSPTSQPASETGGWLMDSKPIGI
ncbi:hypothetical protein KCU66_g12533, partial [Aureobasidium melanogenum]